MAQFGRCIPWAHAILYSVYLISVLCQDNLALSQIVSYIFVKTQEFACSLKIFGLLLNASFTHNNMTIYTITTEL